MSLVSWQTHVFTLRPGWENMAAMPWSPHDHTIIMAKHGHHHAVVTAWPPCFLAWSSWFMAWSWYDYHVLHGWYHDHSMIIIFSMFFFAKKWNVRQCFLKKLLPYTIIWYSSLVLEDFTPPNCRLSKIKRILLPKDLVIFGNNQTASSFYYTVSI